MFAKRVFASVLTFDLFLSSFFVERKANSAIDERTIEQGKRKGHEKRDQFLVPKVEFNYRIAQRNINFIYWSCFFFQLG